jgi:lipopolysaccharide export system protein LptA
MLKEFSVRTSIYCKSSYKFLFCSILICCALFWFSSMLYSQTSKNIIRQKPLHVVSDKMVAQKESAMVEFIGNVKAEQEDSTVMADSIKIYFTDDNDKTESNKTNAESNVKKIVSTGNVRYTAGERKAFADKAVYTTIDDTLVLTGNSPKLITGSSFVTGKKITLFRKQDKVIVESGENRRVEALFNPEDTITKKSGTKDKIQN